MAESYLSKKAKATLASIGAQLLEKNPEKNVEKLFSLLKKYAKDDFTKARVDATYEFYNNNEVIRNYILSILKETNKNCLKKFFVNFLGNATWYGIPKREEVGEENKTKVPFVLLISPTMRCNLRCKGCYAANYTKDDDLGWDEVDRLVGEARDMGIYFMVILGGETFIDKHIIDIYKKYNDVYFMPYTNGTLINDEMADTLADLGNVLPIFSLEGYREETDTRRAPGVFDKVMHGMDLLKARGVPFGASLMTSNQNVDLVTSNEFMDMLIDKGVRLVWYFMFMPVGEDPKGDMKYMLNPDERLRLGRRTKEIRTTKPIFTADFFNDAPYVGGCIAGKYYCHINVKGDLEPCIFAHYATDNVIGKPLMECFKHPFFREIRSRQPFSDNMLRPCMMIDNTEEIREIVAKTGAYPTHQSANLMIHDKEFQDMLDQLADDFKVEADKEFEKRFPNKGNQAMAKTKY